MSNFSIFKIKALSIRKESIKILDISGCCLKFLKIEGKTENKTKYVSTNPRNFTVCLADSMLFLKHIKEKFYIPGTELSL